MSRRQLHLADEEIVALTYMSGDEVDVRDADALSHVAGCDVCGRRLAETAATMAELRLAAEEDADAHFPEFALERQRRQILARIDHMGQSPRVLRFPAVSASPAPVVVERAPVRRWLAGAVAAGLLGGFLLAESLHMLPGDAGWVSDRRAATSAGASAELVDIATLDDDDFLSEIDAALGFSPSSELRALDALTPVSYEIR